MSIQGNHLGTSTFLGGYTLKFQNKNSTIIAKLYQGDTKLGKCSLSGLPIQQWTYNDLPEKFKTAVDALLTRYGVPMNPEHALHNPQGTNLSHPVVSDYTFPSMRSDKIISESSQISIEELKKHLLSLRTPESEINTIIERASQKENQPFLVDILFDHILSLSILPSITPSILDKRDSRGNTLLHAAVTQGNQKTFQALFAYYKDKLELFATNPQGLNALHLASGSGHADIVKFLLSEGFQSDEKDAHGLVPLHWAVHENHPETVLALIQGGTSLATPWVTPRGIEYYPLAMAIAAGSPAVLKVLLENDPFHQLNLLQSVPEIGTLLHLAIRNNQALMLEHLLSMHAAEMKNLFNHRDPQGRTPLQLAAYLGDLFAIRLLHKHDIDLNYGEGQRGGTAVHFAAQGEQPDAIRLLDFLGAPLQRTDDEGNTPINLLKSRKTPAAMKCKGFLTNLPGMGRAEKTAPPNYTRRPPFNLVVQGGGPVGIAYLGALQKMEDLGTLSELKRVAGTSAGAITAAFLAVGCNSRELENHLNRNLVEFLDGSGATEDGLLKAVQNSSYADAVKGLLRDYWGGWRTLLHPIKRAEMLKQKIVDLQGLAHGEAIREWIEQIIQEKTGKEYCTFKELRELVDKDPQKFKELHIFSIRIGNNPIPNVVRFSHEEKLWNDLIISDAVRASLSIPGVFKPHTLHFKDANGTRYPQDQHGKFIDGGLIRNYPIDAFDEEKYQEDRHFRGEKTNRRTLGLSLHDVTPPNEEQIQGISSGSDVIKALVSTFYNAEQILLEETGFYRDRSIIIPTQGVGLMDFNMSDEMKESLVNAGVVATDSFFTPSHQ